jgi:aarF domain-containing kinase
MRLIHQRTTTLHQACANGRAYLVIESRNKERDIRACLTSTMAAWVRVAMGLQKVTEAVVARAELPSTAVRVWQHGVDVAASCRSAAESATSQHSTTTSTVPFASNHTGFSPASTVDDSADSSNINALERAKEPSPKPLEPPITPFVAINGFRRETQQHGQFDGSISSSADNTPTEQRDHVVRSDREASIETSQRETSDPIDTVPILTHLAADADDRFRQSATAPETTIGTPLGRMEASSLSDVLSNRNIAEGTPVPSTRIARALGFAQLGVGLAWGGLSEKTRRLLGSQDGDATSSSTSAMLNDANSDRLAASLCRMRGAALKMGQMLSIQDESLLPPPLTRALAQVRQGANAMPLYQLVQQLEGQLGLSWRDNFETFDTLPFAAASIGQVHRAVLRQQDYQSATDPASRHVVVKVQYPGVAQSIESDLRNLAMLVTWSGLAPPGLFLENVIRVGQEELKVECDYRREMMNQQRMKQLVESDATLRDNQFVVPSVVEELTTNQVIVSEYLPGGTIDKIAHLADQSERNRIGRTILYLTMKELFEWRFMQTDPNWGNFLYDVHTRRTALIDFGAARSYDKDFVDGYLRIVWASANRDETTLLDQSLKMGFLTGRENAEMLRAHTLSGFTVGEPFACKDNSNGFDFRSSNISTRMGEHTSVFLKHRLTPPPQEVYTLHRKLAGAYMLCIKLGAVVADGREMLESIVAHHTFDDGLPNPLTGAVSKSVSQATGC